MNDPERIFTTDAVRNFRDAGGWRTRDGARVRWRTFLRSGHWADAKDTDLQLLQALEPDVMVDLRRPREREIQPNRLPPDCRVTTLSAPGADDGDPPHLQFLRAGNLSRESVWNYMCSSYGRFSHEDHHRELFSQTIRQLGQGRKVLIHCAAGKDRTGLLSALVLKLLGVEDDAVFEDYLLTNQAVDVAGVLPEIAKQISGYLGQDIEPDVLFPMIGVQADYLRKGLSEMGDVERYARTALGLDNAKINALRDNLLN